MSDAARSERPRFLAAPGQADQLNPASKYHSVCIEPSEFASRPMGSATAHEARHCSKFALTDAYETKSAGLTPKFRLLIIEGALHRFAQAGHVHNGPYGPTVITRCW